MTKNMTLEDLVMKYKRGKSNLEAIKRAYDEWVEGEIKLIDPDPPRDYLEFLLRPAYNLWFWISLSLVALTLIAIYLTDILPPIIYLRYVLGSVFVLFLSGMSLIEALYPVENELSPLERLALSIGLSLALVPLVGLVLNYTPWGIRLIPILISLTLLTVALLIGATYRKYRAIIAEYD